MPDPLHDMLKSLEKHDIDIIYFANRALIAKSPKTGEVIKFVKDDKAYIAFLKIIAGKNSQYYPKITAFKKLTQGKFKGIYVVKMEKLIPVTQKEFSENVFPITKLLVYPYNGPDDQFKKQDEAKVFAIEDQNFVKAVQYLYKRKPSFAKWDLSSGNVMKRQEGGFVIIDPYFLY